MLTDSSNTRVENVVANESNGAASSISTFRTAQIVDAEMNAPELPADEDGKVTESKFEAPTSSTEGDDVDGRARSMSEVANLPLTYEPTVHHPIPSIEICEDESETTERAIITTHISAQKMYDFDFSPFGGQYEDDGTGKLGGIHVMIEQVVEIELNMGRLSPAATE
jgi:hypothetical protein